MTSGPRPLSPGSHSSPRRRHDHTASAPLPGETPVLLRLPDLYPSEDVDAAVARLSGHSATLPSKREQAGPAQAARTAREDRPMTTPSGSPRALKPASHHADARGPDSWREPERPEARDSVKSGAGGPELEPTDWTSRIIVSCIVITLFACAVTIHQRSQRDRRDNHSASEARSTSASIPVPQAAAEQSAATPEVVTARAPSAGLEPPLGSPLNSPHQADAGAPYAGQAVNFEQAVTEPPARGLEPQPASAASASSPAATLPTSQLPTAPAPSGPPTTPLSTSPSSTSPSSSTAPPSTAAPSAGAAEQAQPYWAPPYWTPPATKASGPAPAVTINPWSTPSAKPESEDTFMPRTLRPRTENSQTPWQE